MSDEHKTKEQLLDEVRLLRIQVNRLKAEKAQVMETMEKRIAELETLNTIGNAIALETNLTALYQLIHSEIQRMMGEVVFYIALYRSEDKIIEIPYAFEGNEMLKIEPFPLGEGLTSIVIQSRQPLMLVEDTANKARRLGAKVTGRPAKSWLGVPLILGSEVIGALIVQDTDREQRFNENDQRLLSILAPQIAIVIRNARLLSDVRQQYEHQRILAEVSAKVWRSTDIGTILKTALHDIGAALGATEGLIVLEQSVSDAGHPTHEVTNGNKSKHSPPMPLA
jgi:GAF domain-containing protein